MFCKNEIFSRQLKVVNSLTGQNRFVLTIFSGIFVIVILTSIGTIPCVDAAELA